MVIPLVGLEYLTWFSVEAVFCPSAIFLGISLSLREGVSHDSHGVMYARNDEPNSALFCKNTKKVCFGKRLLIISSYSLRH